MPYSAVCLLATLGLAHCVIAEEPATPNEPTLHLTYVVRDAPVWTAQGKFDPVVLIKLIEASTDLGDGASTPSIRIHEFPQSGALFIRATVSDHKKILKLLRQFPAVDKALGPDDPNYAELLQDQIEQRERTLELHRLSDQIERDRMQKLLEKHTREPFGDPVVERP